MGCTSSSQKQKIETQRYLIGKQLDKKALKKQFSSKTTGIYSNEYVFSDELDIENNESKSQPSSSIVQEIEVTQNEEELNPQCNNLYEPIYTQRQQRYLEEELSEYKKKCRQEMIRQKYMRIQSKQQVEEKQQQQNKQKNQQNINKQSNQIKEFYQQKQFKLSKNVESASLLQRRQSQK